MAWDGTEDRSFLLQAHYPTSAHFEMSLHFLCWQPQLAQPHAVKFEERKSFDWVSV
jgi:hypothetical protein